MGGVAWNACRKPAKVQSGEHAREASPLVRRQDVRVADDLVGPDRCNELHRGALRDQRFQELAPNPPRGSGGFRQLDRQDERRGSGGQPISAASSATARHLTQPGLKLRSAVSHPGATMGTLETMTLSSAGSYQTPGSSR